MPRHRATSQSAREEVGYVQVVPLETVTAMFPNVNNEKPINISLVLQEPYSPHSLNL